MIPENKLLWTFGTFTASLLFGVICIYTRGNWFFVASLSVLFGFSVCFLPFEVYAKPIGARICNQKGLTVMTADTLLYALMMLSIGLFVKSEEFWRVAGKDNDKEIFMEQHYLRRRFCFRKKVIVL